MNVGTDILIIGKKTVNGKQFNDTVELGVVSYQHNIVFNINGTNIQGKGRFISLGTGTGVFLHRVHEVRQLFQQE
jgi:hypothetical protein